MTLTELNKVDADAKREAQLAHQASVQRDLIVKAKADNIASLVLAVDCGTDTYNRKAYRAALGYGSESVAREAVDAAAAQLRDQILDLAAAALEAKSRTHLLRSQALRAQIDIYLARTEDTPCA